MGDTVYFSVNGYNCSIGPDGSAGCDLHPAQSVMWVSTTGMREQDYPVPFVPAVIVDRSSMPGRPDWIDGGRHTRPGGNPILRSINGEPPTIDYAGASCWGSESIQFGCVSGGHGFGSSSGVLNGY